MDRNAQASSDDEITADRKDVGAKGFAGRLAHALAAAGLNQKELAAAVHVREATVTAWFQGTLPAGKSFVRLREVLNVSGHWLMTGEGPMRYRASDRRDWALDAIGRIVDAVRAGATEELAAEVDSALQLLAGLPGSPQSEAEHRRARGAGGAEG